MDLLAVVRMAESELLRSWRLLERSFLVFCLVIACNFCKRATSFSGVGPLLLFWLAIAKIIARERTPTIISPPMMILVFLSRPAGLSGTAI